MSFGCELVNGTKLLVDVIFDKSSNATNVQVRGPNEEILPYFVHALGMIVSLWCYMLTTSFFLIFS